MGALTLTPNLVTWAIAAVATLGVITRPFSWPEAIWAVLLDWAGCWTSVGVGFHLLLFLFPLFYFN